MGAGRIVTGEESASVEIAAVMAAVQLYMASSARPGRTIDLAEQWIRAGRLEAQGLPTTIRPFRSGWRI
jgi:hypothetical protein